MEAFILFVKVIGKTSISNSNTSSETMLAEIKPTNLTLEGGLSFSGGTGTNTLQLQPTTSAQINTGIKYHSGGAANFVLQTSMVSVGGNVVAKSAGPMAFSLVGPQLLSVEGRVSVLSSAGSTLFFLVGSGAVAGGVSAAGKLGGSVTMGSPLQIGKSATFNFAQATSPVGVSISSSTFLGSVSIATGSANDAISINDGTITGKLTILGGGENDTIGLENTGVATLTVAGPVLVNAGGGNDSVTAGNIVFGKLNAFAPVILIGGSGSDSLALAANNNILLAGSTATGFEVGS